jgi:hypothetical protein
LIHTSGPCKVFLVLLFACFVTQSTQSSPSEKERISEALAVARVTPEKAVQFNYVMTARLRLLLFWVGKDEVGGGYIQRGVAKDDPRKEIIQVLFGSDPAIAPRAINRWGAGTEVEWHDEAGANGSSSLPGNHVSASTFFGFMKSSRGKSVTEMKQELSNESSKGEHLFTGILSYVDPAAAVSTTIPLNSATDYTLHQYGDAEPIMFDRLKTLDRPVRTLANRDACNRSVQFLGTVEELISDALAGGKPGRSLCYIYDAKLNTLTLTRTEPVKNLELKIKSAKGGVLLEKSYDQLLQADFVSAEPATGKKTDFTLLVGTQGELRGIPVQIRYQPNWWFQVVLNLR